MGSSAQGPGQPSSPRLMARYTGGLIGQGLSAEAIARKWGLTRADVDAFSPKAISGRARHR